MKLSEQLQNADCKFSELQHEYAERAKAMEDALEKIERWTEFPETGDYWADDGTPVSYGAAHGTYGERDYMRAIAREALSKSALPITTNHTGDNCGL